MKKYTIVLVLCLLLSGCGKEDPPPTVVSKITYRVDTGDTVEVVMTSTDGYSIELLNDDSIIIKSNEDIADVKFTDTSDVLTYTSDTVPKVLANYPAYWLETKSGDTLALMLGDDTTMLVTSLVDTDYVTAALNCCDIFIY